jgi:hypothetical protein
LVPFFIEWKKGTEIILRIKNMKGTFIILLLASMAAGHTFAQTENNKIVTLASVKKDSIILRWVPASIPVWQMGNKYGYIVERYTISKGGNFIPDGLAKGTLLTPQPLKPVSNEAFEKLSQTDDRASVVQEAIYGNTIEPPKDDFNGFMKSYGEVETRFGFALFMCDLSPATAKAAGLQFTDRNIAPDERYAYSVSLVKVPEGMTVPPSVIVVDADKMTKLPKIGDVKIIFLDKTAKLQWPVDLHKGIYTAYMLEKNTDGTNYASVSDLPLVTVSEKENPTFFVYTDSLKENGVQTWYRVKGVNPFGETGPASDPVSGKGVPDFSVYVAIDTAVVIENKKITVKWRVTEAKPGLVKGINIAKANKPDGPFQNLNAKPLLPNTRTFTDTKPFISNYYKVTLLGTQNRKSVSFQYLVQTEDNDPPAAPQMLAGKVDSSGIVTLAWMANTEPDLAGYRVYRGNSPKEEFVRRGRNLVPVNRYTDTINLNTLTQKVYYKVLAVDKHYNNSAFSQMVELSRPDTIPPSPGIMKLLLVDNTTVTLTLESSPSNDVDSYKLFRKAEDDFEKIEVVSWKGTLPAEYKDIVPSHASVYDYTLETIDKNGNKASYNRNIFVPAGEEPVSELKIDTGKTAKTIVLSWKIPANIQPVKTVIYRCESNKPLNYFHTVEGATEKFEDTEMKENIIYTYRIRIVGKKGSLQLSNPVSNQIKINR